MTAAEKLVKRFTEGNGTIGADNAMEKDAGRKRAAKSWVMNFVSVTKFIKEAKASGVEFTSVKGLEEALYESWIEKEESRDDEFLDLIGEL